MSSAESLDFVDLPKGSGAGVAPISNTQQSSIPTATANGSSLIFDPSTTIRATSHPLVALFHVLFKVLSLLFYLFSSFITSNFVFTFVLSVLLLSADFWVVKNVSGRRLVGLRWWSSVLDDGSTTWVFESSPNSASHTAADRNVFWTALYLAPACWSGLLLLDLVRLKLSYALVPVVALAMSAANITGFTRCSKDQKARINEFVTTGIGRVMGNEGIRNTIVGWVAGGGNTGGYANVNDQL
ncbi:hypothetical protein TrCOL_g10600 [Triparma columacea]|uniref:Golgi apparatus membrane protein TVP23 homolog n=1 Tax=Triparma columacea TaxID=722753 RepID=A0A9W7FXZ0_9STRA|nr:hypothetical protein TrCOL_g10600 [Triparma columacea]